MGVKLTKEQAALYPKAKQPQLPHQPSDVERAWLAGLFEGEGCISFSKSKHVFKNGQKSTNVYPVLVIASTDLDVIEKFGQLVGFGRIYGPYWLKHSTKPQWHWRGSGWLVINALWRIIGDHLGNRRQGRFKEVLSMEPAKPVSSTQLNCEAPSLQSYRRHLKQNTVPCEACCAANTKAHRDYKDRVNPNRTPRVLALRPVITALEENNE